jgi:hypothetical protein
MAVEFFVLKDGRIVFNEMAPRPHNSGHYTLDACATDQFQQQVRALCGLPLGDPRLLSPVVMVNLLGDVWRPEPRWDELLKHPGVQLHLYGKAEARPGRKMGHYNCLAESVASALSLAPGHPRRAGYRRLACLLQAEHQHLALLVQGADAQGQPMAAGGQPDVQRPPRPGDRPGDAGSRQEPPPPAPFPGPRC